MKKFRKIMAVLAAAALTIGSMTVPAWATESDAGRFDGYATAQQGTTGNPGNGKYGTITIANPKVDETYTAYRIFDLASFYDTDTATGSHTGTEDGTAQVTAATEWYSYVISATKADKSTTNPWWTFVTTWGYTASNGTETYKYAVPESYGLDTATAAHKKEYENAYFWYSDEAVSLNGKTDYHIIKANQAMFDNDDDDQGATTSRTDNGTDDGVSAGIDYVLDNNKVIQAFAQEAMRFISENPSSFTVPDKTNGITSLQATAANLNDGLLKLIRQDAGSGNPGARDDNMTLGYYLVSTTMGTLMALDTTNKNVIVYEKNDEPLIDKKVLKKGSIAFIGGTEDYPTKNATGDTYDDSAYWVANTDADIEDYIQFRTVITVEQGMKDYKLHDVMEQGLTFKNAEYTPFATLTDDTKYGYRVVLERDSGTGTSKTTEFFEIPSRS